MAANYEIPPAAPTRKLKDALVRGSAVLAVSIIPEEKENELLAAGFIQRVGNSRLLYPEALREDGWELELIEEIGNAPWHYRYIRVEREARDDQTGKAHLQ